MSRRNNRLKCLEFSNSVDCYYVKHIAVPVPAGGAGRAIALKFPIFGQNSNFSGSDIKNLGKVRSFRVLTLNNCKNQLPNLGEDLFGDLGHLGEDLFFLENTLILA